MKKFLIITIVLLQTFCNCFASEEIALDLSDSDNNSVAIVEPEKKLFSDVEKQKILNGDFSPEISGAQPITTDEVNPNFLLNNAFSRGLSKLYHLEAERTDVTTSLLKKHLTHEFESGPIEKIYFWSAYHGNFVTTIPEKGKGNTVYNPALINLLIDGTFRGGKESFRFMLDPGHQHNRGFMSQFLQDAYIQTTRVSHHTILFGNSRVGIGDEGRAGIYTLPLINRSQSSRAFSNIRKFGVRVKGDYKLVDYDIGGYSSDTFFQSFFPGAEFNGWVNFKPLGMTDGKYGKLVTGGGISAGRNHIDYFLSGLYAGYEYKKFWAKFEYMHANGANAQAGPTMMKANGMFATVAYRVTPKFEILARYDSFDPNERIKNDISREYTAGMTYFLKGQALRLMLNYVFCQRQNANDSHRILVGTQILL